MKKHIILLLMVPFLMFSQESSFHKYKIGLNGSLLYNMHQGTFGTYEGVLDCGFFKDANSLGWTVGNVIDVPMFSFMDLSLRVKYFDASANFTSQNANNPRISLQNNTLTYFVTEQSLETVLDYFSLDLMGIIPVYKTLYLGIGPSVSLPNRTMYSQYEEILSPAGITFVDGSTKRKIISGKFGEDNIHKRQIRVALLLSAGAEIPLTGNFFINPEIGYSLPFTKVLSESDWKFQSLYAGISLKYSLEKPKVIIQEAPKEIPKPVEPVVVQKIEKPQPVSVLQCKNVYANGNISNYSEILIKEESSNQIVPLLPYLFFESNKSEIQTRYNQLSANDARSFDESQLRDSVLGIYHNLLNIIGSRMKKNPDSKIKITGCIEPKNDDIAGLSLSRAETVKNYLVNVFGISPDRITVKSRKLPEMISNRSDDDGLAENRRVEIASDDASILAPVKLSYNNAGIEPESVKIDIQTQFPESVSSWEIKVEAENGEVMITNGGTGKPPTEFNWAFSKAQIVKLSSANPPVKQFNVSLALKTEKDKVVNANSQIPLRKQVFSRQFTGELVRDSVIDRFNLIFFDFDKPSVSKFNKDVVPLIQSRIRTNSKVDISGLTDRIGKEKHNIELSEQRAESLKEDILERIVPEKLNSIGLGEKLIYNNDLPEGRFYNRTVIIEVTTPYNY